MTPQDYYSARTQSRFTLTQAGFSFAAVSAEEGMTNVQFLMRDFAPIQTMHPLSTLPPTFFVVEDMNSHAILLLGMTAPDSATVE